MTVSNRMLNKLTTAKPERPIELKVATVYSNSIEIEWRQGGLSDVNVYTVKYRQHPLDAELEWHLDDDEDDEVSHDDGTTTDYSEENAPAESLVDFYYKQVNTSSTKIKVGGNLKAHTLYEFRVSAVNALGASDQTESLLVRTAATSRALILF